MPRSWATCAIGRFDSKTRRTARSRSSSGYFLGLAIAGASPSAGTEPGIGASKNSRVLHYMVGVLKSLGYHAHLKAVRPIPDLSAYFNKILNPQAHAQSGYF